MYQHKHRRFRYRSNGKSHQTRSNESAKARLGSGSFSNDRPKHNFRTQQSAEKLVEKYNTLAKEASTSGDKILSENYFQHADHFIRIVDEKNLNQKQNQAQVNNKSEASVSLSVENKKIDQHRNIEVNKK